VALLASITACQPTQGGEPPEPPDNPEVSWVNPNPPACASRDIPPLTPFNPVEVANPQVPPAWKYQVISVEIRAINMVGTVDACVPVAIHVYATSDAGSGIGIVSTDGTPHTTPYDTLTNTPYEGVLIPAYDPTSKRFQNNPPTYFITARVTYFADRDVLNDTPPNRLQCIIRLSGVEVAYTPVNPVGDKAFAECKYHNNVYL
jgi:hypothetical protein